jgi:ABC-type lipoprotein release transport system permease subunit
LSALLFGVGAVDLRTYSTVTVSLLAVVLLASYMPARRAASVAPTDALRWE